MEDLKKRTIGIIADEAVDLPDNLVKEKGISLVNFRIDAKELEQIPGNIYKKMKEGERRGIKTTIKTSQPALNDFLKAFRGKLEQYDYAVCFVLSSKFSGTYNAAVQAIKFLPVLQQDRVKVIDTASASGAEGLLVLWATDIFKQNKPLDWLIKTIEKAKPSFKLICTYENAKWLEATGRVPKIIPAGLKQVEKWQIKPILALKNGKITFKKLKRITSGLAETLFEEFKSETETLREKGQNIKTSIIHADNMEEANNLKRMLQSLGSVTISFTNIASFVVGGSIGPGSLILAWQE
ncbi:MAG: DegV family protein [Candidatus Pacebacteria bacterium]|nr:DegV family protein [Candidatus Paceibacterota bacterium]